MGPFLPNCIFEGFFSLVHASLKIHLFNKDVLILTHVPESIPVPRHFAQVTYVLKLVNEMSIFFYIAELIILACLAKGCDRAR